MIVSSPEAVARLSIDAALVAAGWVLQDVSAINLYAGRGIAVREFPLKSGYGFADYLLFVDRKPASATPRTKNLWIYDLRIIKNFTLKTNPLRRADLDELVACFHSANRHDRRETWSEANPDGRWRRHGYDELIARDKGSLDILWLRDESLEDGANLPDPDILAAEIIEDLRAALEEFELIGADLARVSEH